MASNRTSATPVPEHSTGALILNADDWGRDGETTDRTFDCIQRQTVSAVSAMMFMEDSERAAELAREHGIDAGLHLNFTTAFTGQNVPSRLMESQSKIAAYLSRNPFTRGIFNPLLARDFEYVFAAQKEEFCRLFGREPQRYDGHHHMHLAANVLIGGYIPHGTCVRQHFSHEAGEKSARNGIFRMVTRIFLGRRYRTVDYLFSLPPMEPPGRLNRIFSLARRFAVEVETHPTNPREYQFLTEGEIFHYTGHCPIATRYAVPTSQ